MNEPAASIISIISYYALKTDIQCPFFIGRVNCFFMEAVEMSPNAALECGQTVNTKTTERRYFYTYVL